jgi:ANTAR domain
MLGLAASAEPAVVLSSLARCCIATFSDSCSVELSEGVESLFRVTFPAGEEETFAAKPGSVVPGGAPRKGGRTVSTSFQAESTLGFPSYAGVVLHSWHAHDATDDDAIIARLLVDRAVALVHQERLAQCTARADERAARLALELITSRAEGEAVGILTTKHNREREEALRLLRRASRTSQRTLYEVATDVIRTGDLDYPPAFPSGRADRQNLHIVARSDR